MKPNSPFERDLVLIGGGHTHALVIRMLAMKPIEGVRVTLISDTIQTPYSGMLPGFLAGHYSVDDTHIDLNQLCRLAGVRFVHDRVIGLDPQHHRVQLAQHADLSYDKLSINTGSTPNLSLPGAREHAIGVKPVSQLKAKWQQLLDRYDPNQPPHWTVVGGGAAGVEVVLAMAHRFAQQGQPIQLSLLHAGTELLRGYRPGVRRRAELALKRAGVERISGFNVAQVKADALISDRGQRLSTDQSLWCTPAAAPSWPGDAGLDTDRQGFIAVNRFLQSTSHPDIYACGDVAAMVQSPRPKAGVYAVRSAPFLAENLRRSFTAEPPKPVRLQTDFLSLLSLGDRTAAGQRGPLSFSGAWVWRWKDRIDRAFMRRFSEFGQALPATEASTMHCAGCGSKLGPAMLSETLSELGYREPAEDAVALPLKQGHLWQSLDGFRSFTDDLYRLGIVSVHHAVNDSYAMGLAPSSAQVWINLAFSHPRLARRDFKWLMHGVHDALREHDARLIGGHSTEGAETHMAVVVNAEGQARWPKRGAQPGDWLMLNRPIGTGILLAADMAGSAHPADIESLWQHLLTSNRDFFEALADTPVNAATDITGFGLIGHVLEMMADTSTSAVIEVDTVPLLPGAHELSKQGVQSTLLPQLEPLLRDCQIERPTDARLRCLLDPQTQGGLLVSVSPEHGQSLLDAGLATRIGQVRERQVAPVLLH
ncbi:selenide, water dikinase SelD [Reinekea blandensis]|uniref:Selenide, water dikinase, putative n=1 Tax=Reinekea blandensis MED297 TaxID=314283 RepID=A4BDG5_9GAMM|nr:selenide, water dikinase SelD [Reinekea blandensis]EAR09909.1 selenide, water dikinase, putative [Reinekea sp. MED297] [Reinekea blandensis MED297]